MSELEEKLGTILNNPQMMQQIMSIAQAMDAGQPQKKEEPKTQEPQAAKIPEVNPQMLSSLAGLARNTGADRNQQALLKALSPYLSRDRVCKLERAMRAAKMAGAASAFLNAGGLQMLGRR